MNSFQEDLAAIARTAIAEVAPEHAIQGMVEKTGDTLHVSGRAYDLAGYERIVVLAAGKAAAPMARALEDLLGERLTRGVAVTKYGHGLDLERIEVLEASHPAPDAAGLAAAERLLDEAEQCEEGDLVFCLLSGGASALLPAPVLGVSLADKQEMTRMLLACGAEIHEINTVRKHLSRIKGGGLAAALAPATVCTLIISDVVGDDLDVIASGPTSPDKSSFADCLEVLRRYDLMKSDSPTPRAILEHLRRGARGAEQETQKAGAPCFANVRNLIAAGNRQALDAAAQEAERRGYSPLIFTSRMRGEAREVAKVAAAIAEEVALGRGPVEAPACLLFGGETTVTIQGTGNGGRNQELALALGLALENAPQFQSRIAGLCFGTDGTDGPTDAAGAFALPGLLDKARAQGADPREHLAENNSYELFKPVDGLLKTGPTRTNVMDVLAVLVGEE